MENVKKKNGSENYAGKKIDGLKCNLLYLLSKIKYFYSLFIYHTI